VLLDDARSRECQYSEVFHFARCPCFELDSCRADVKLAYQPAQEHGHHLTTTSPWFVVGVRPVRNKPTVGCVPVAAVVTEGPKYFVCTLRTLAHSEYNIGSLYRC
jgi:hypothetical protein